LAQLLEKVPARDVAVAVRDPENAADLAAKSVDVRYADYSKPETLSPALAGVEKLLLICIRFIEPCSERGGRIANSRA
jgi:NAD(P)H dehydrogenase (quinone)